MKCIFRTAQNSVKDFFTKGHERTLRAKRNILGSFAIKGLTIGTDLLLIPLTITYVNPSQYGIWLTLSSVIAWVSFFDIGFGNGLRNRFAEAKANSDMEEAKIYVSTTYAVLTIIFCLIWIIFYICNFLLDWSVILNAPNELAAELSILALIIFSFFCLQIIFKIITTVIVADQKPAKASVLNFLGQALSLLVIYILTSTSDSSLIYLGFAMGSAPVLVFVLSSIYFYKGSYKNVAPSIKSVNFAYTSDILNLGIKFFIIQIAFMAIFQANNLIIAQIGEPEDVTIYNVSYKYMAVTLMIFTIVISPYWSAFTEAYSKKDYIWMNDSLNKLRKISIIQICIVVIMLGSSEFLYKLWLPDEIVVPFSVTLTIGLYMVIYSIVSLNSIVLNGIGKIKIQTISYVSASILHVPTAIYFGKMYGIVGVVSSATFFFGILGLIFIFQVNRILNQKATGLWNK